MNLGINKKWNHTFVLFALFIFVLFIQFWVSIDSYTHDLYGRVDSAWYFMGGRALINGLIPYVEFTDVKGPFLWVIYGIAYVISCHTYLGVFWISVISYTLTFFVCYKIFCFYERKEISLVLAYALGVFYFNPEINYSTEAETFTLPFIAFALFSYLYIDKTITDGNDNNKEKVIKNYSTYIGICVAVPFLIKFSIGALIAFIPFLLLSRLIYTKKWNCLFCSAMCLMGGFLLIVLPVWLFLLYRGSFGAYLYEVFIYTLKTVSLPIELLPNIYMQEWHKVLTTSKVFFLISVFAIIYVERNVNRFALALCSFVFLAMSIRSDNGYYTNICNVWCIYLILAIKKLADAFFGKRILNVYHFLLLLCIIPLVIVYIVKPWNRPHFFNKTTNRIEYYRCANIMAQIEKPRVLNYRCFEFGLGLLADALPACKRYAQPYRPYSEDNNEIVEQKICLKNKIPDFVICEDVDAKEVERFGYIYLANYHRYENTWNNHVNFCLYGRPTIRSDIKDLTISDWDVLLKRTICPTHTPRN